MGNMTIQEVDVTVKAHVYTLEPNTMFEKTFAGVIFDPNGSDETLELYYTGTVNGSPLIKMPDGTFVSFRWGDLATSAIEAVGGSVPAEKADVRDQLQAEFDQSYTSDQFYEALSNIDDDTASDEERAMVEKYGVLFD